MKTASPFLYLPVVCQPVGLRFANPTYNLQLYLPSPLLTKEGNPEGRPAFPSPL